MSSDPQTGFVSSRFDSWDILEGAKNWRLWAFLGLQDIRSRYRRSSFGPLWLAMGLGVTILGIGILYSQILKTNPGTFLPYFAVSLWIWTLIGSVIAESTMLFQGGSGMITSMRVPYTSFALRCIVRNLIVMAHCAVPVVIAFAFFRFPVHLIALAAIPGLLIIVLNLYWLSLAVGLVCLRYRDFGQIINYATQLALFITPIIWQPTQIKADSPALIYNPFYHLIQLVRGPVFYGIFPTGSFIFCTVMMIIGMAAALFTFVRMRRLLVFWM